MSFSPHSDSSSSSQNEHLFQVLSFQAEDGNGPKTLQAKRYQKRRAHSKSKTGCINCKVKRVKCDETKPNCRRCQRSKAWCAYNVDQDIRKSKGTDDYVPVDWDSVMLRTAPSPPLPAYLDSEQNPSPYGTPRIVLLHHFLHVFPHLRIMGAPIASPVIDLALTRTHLLDAILAVSASHLRHHTPAHPSSSYRVAEHFQQSLAIRNFQTALAEPLDQQGSDALILTSMMLNLLSYSLLEDDDPATSWVFSTSEDRLGWLSLQMGLKPLLYATHEFHGEGTILKWIFDASDDDCKTFHGEGHSLQGVPAHWLSLCSLTGVDETSRRPEHEVFYESIRTLAVLRNLKPQVESFFLYLNFFGTVDIEFRDLLRVQDVRALWILGFWLGLLRRYDSWWLNKRVLRDHRAIMRWLRLTHVTERAGEEGEMWRKLMADLANAPSWPFRDAAGEQDKVFEVEGKGYPAVEDDDFMMQRRVITKI